MKKVTVINLLVTSILVCAAGVCGLSAEERMLYTKYKMVKTNNEGQPACSEEEQWRAAPQDFDAAELKGKIYGIGDVTVKGHNAPAVFATPQALFESAKEGNIERVNFILSTKPRYLNMVDKYDRTLLIVAIRGGIGHLAVVKNVLKKLEKAQKKVGRKCDKLISDPKRFVNYPDVKGRTALWYAVDRQKPSIVKILLENGADVDLDKLPLDVYQRVSINKQQATRSLLAKKREPYTILMQSVRSAKKDNPKIVSLLLAEKPDVFKKTDIKGNTALHMAARRGYIQIATALLDACPDKSACLNMRAADGFTPWMRAMSYKQEEMAAFLETQGTQITKEDRTVAKQSEGIAEDDE